MRRHVARSVACSIVVLTLGACSTNAPAVAPTSSGGHRVTYVALGNGETAGNTVKDRIRSAWPQLLFRSVFPRSAVFVNFGQNSVTIDQAFDSQLAPALALAPNIATVTLTDDTFLTGDPVDFERKFTTLIHRLQRGGRTTVVIGNIPPGDREPGIVACAPNPPAGSKPCQLSGSFDITAANARDGEFNAAIARVATAANARLVDLHAAFLRARTAGQEDAFWIGNDFSPNEAGHAYIARQFAPAVRAALKSSR